MNEWGRCHDVRNLFIIDGSVFVTAGAVNPDQYDPGARAAVADTIKQNLGELFD